MSTFDGFVKEFPDISIDHFRRKPERVPPSVCFLSHVHSDHVAGLDTYRGSRIFCSSTTRALLLNYEPRKPRLNFHQGIIEVRKRPYDSKELRALLKPIPLNTPSNIEIKPNVHIRVTLLQANHCPGAVMFLIQGKQETILYTGDIRAEPWLVDSLTRNPIMIPFTKGLDIIDTVYLDTTFALPHQKDFDFPSKADGIAELLGKLKQYAPEVVFLLPQWTLGYEDAWLAVSYALESQIHVDEYKFGLFRSLHGQQTKEGLNSIHEGAAFTGCEVGNSQQPGVLTTESRDTRLHACDPEIDCSGLISDELVRLCPILGYEGTGKPIWEPAMGFGPETPLSLDKKVMIRIAEILSEHGGLELGSEIPIRSVLHKLPGTAQDKVVSLLRIASENTADDPRDAELPMSKSRSQQASANFDRSELSKGQESLKSEAPRKASRKITFPFSRHSSYKELCHLLDVLRPRDVHPCTFELSEWSEESSMQALFGKHCAGDIFSYDQAMRLKRQQMQHVALSNKPNDSTPTPNPIMNSKGGLILGIKRKPESTQKESGVIFDTKPRPKRPRNGDKNLGYLSDIEGEDELAPGKGRSDGNTEETQGLAIARSRAEYRARLDPSSPLNQDEACNIDTPVLSIGLPSIKPSILSKSKDLLPPSAGTQVSPIDISDDDDEASTIKTQSAQGVARPSNIPLVGSLDGAIDHEYELEEDDEHKQDTQITLSDAAFESQDVVLSSEFRDDVKARRKGAYVKAKEAIRTPNGGKGIGLLSVRMNHGEDDVEI